MTNSARAIVLVLLTACGSTAPEPSISSVSPDWGYIGDDTFVRVLGDNFVPAIRASVGRDDAADSGVFKVWLVPDEGESSRLSGVEFRGLGELVATVPAGLAPGVYDVLVETPLGKQALSEDLFTVSDSLAASLAVDVPLDNVILTPITATVSVLDPAGAPVALDLPVEIVFIDDETGEPANIEVLSSDELTVAVNDGVGVRGTLGEDGVASVTFQGTLPRLTQLQATVSDAQDVTPATAPIRLENGDQQRVRFILPTEPSPFEAVAGERFLVLAQVVDQNDVIVPTVNRTVFAFDSCTAEREEFTFVNGEGSFSFAHDLMTGTALCPSMALVVAGELSGTSESYTVLPAAADHLVVDVEPSPNGFFVAGDSIGVTVSAADRFDNQTDWDGLLDEFTSTVGDFEDVECSDSKVSLCVASATDAATDIRVLATATIGLVGESQEFTVVAGAPALVSVELPPNVWVAGEPSTVTVSATDEFGNLADAELLDPAHLVWSGSEGTPSCVLEDDSGDGVLEFDCVFTNASTTHTLVTDLVRSGAVVSSFESDMLEVVNGPIATLELALDVGQDGVVVAGESIEVSAVALDAFGNPYVQQSSPTVRINDSSDTVTPATFQLDADGTATVPIVLTRSGSVELSLRAQGVVESNTETLTVVSGDTVSLGVFVDEPWVWVGEATDVRVESLDTWGNRTTYTGPASLSSESDLIEDGPLTVSIANGVGPAQPVWLSGSATERLLVTSGDLEGTSDDIVVVSDCGGNGPQPEVLFRGRDYGVECLNGVPPTARIQASMAGSTGAAGQSVSAFVLSMPGVGSVASFTPDLELFAVESGVYDGLALAVQADTCGAAVEVRAYVGVIGMPVGPIELVPAANELDIGQTLSVEVVGVEDCAGIPAAGSSLFARTDRGELGGLTGTGRGLSTVLDATGGGRFVLDASSAASGGVTTLHAWSESRVAGGTANVLLLGDDQLPTVWTQTPRGQILDDQTTTVQFTFSEPIDPSTVLPAAFSINRGSQAVPIDAVTMPGSSSVHLEVNAGFPDDGGASWRVQIEPTVTDLAGNPLAGAWQGEALYRGFFGSAPTVDPISCEVDRTVFRPDGDDGVGNAADTVQFDFESATAPAWWVVTVTQAIENSTIVHRVEYLSPSGPVGDWVWDGRDGGGRILDRGTYTVSIEAEVEGNREACQRTVDIEHVEVP